MRLYREGDQGEAVRDIQERLDALGCRSDGDRRGVFGPDTRRAVALFQSERGLPADGIVGPSTWRALVGAGYQLGDRLLYHRVPMMSGDDVADLQSRLGSLGFDAGKVDGIFGPDTLEALLEFQANRRMAEDGIAGRAVADELSLMARATSKPGRHLVRDRQWLAGLPPTLVGQRIYVDAFCRTEVEMAATWRAAFVFSRIIQDLGGQPVWSRSADTAPPERVRAVRANRRGVDLIVSFALPHAHEAGVYYFGSTRTTSPAGDRMARAVAARLDVPTLPRTIPMLKDTRSPAVVIAVEPMTEHTGGRVAQGIIDLFVTARDDT